MNTIRLALSPSGIWWWNLVAFPGWHVLPGVPQGATEELVVSQARFSWGEIATEIVAWSEAQARG